jgi:hypothetical protein
VRYKEYADEHIVPSNESLYTLLEIWLGRVGSIPRLATTSTCQIITQEALGQPTCNSINQAIVVIRTRQTAGLLHKGPIKV